MSKNWSRSSSLSPYEHSCGAEIQSSLRPVPWASTKTNPSTWNRMSSMLSCHFQRNLGTQKCRNRYWWMALCWRWGRHRVALHRQWQLTRWCVIHARQVCQRRNICEVISDSEDSDATTYMNQPFTASMTLWTSLRGSFVGLENRTTLRTINQVRFLYDWMS